MAPAEVVVGTLEEPPLVTARNARRSVLRGLLLGLPLAVPPLFVGAVNGSLFAFILAQAVVPTAWVEFWAARWVNSTRSGLAAALLVFAVGGLALGLALLQGLYAMGVLERGGANPAHVLQQLADPDVLVAFFAVLPVGWLMGVASFGRLRGGFTQDGAKVDSLALCLASAAATFVLPMLAALATDEGDLEPLKLATSLGIAAVVLMIPIYLGSGLLFHVYGWADRIEEALFPREAG